jgi:hypothetical protein
MRVFLVQEEFEALYSSDDLQNSHVQTFQDYFEGFVLVASEVGLKLDPRAILPHIEKYDQFAEFILENTILEFYRFEN